MLKAILQELNAHSDIWVVDIGIHGKDLPQLVRDANPDVVVLDLGMSEGGFDPVTAIETLRQTHPQVGILILTGYSDGLWMRELIAAGALGYVLKSDNLSLYLRDGVRAVYRGQRFYSPAVTETYLDTKNNTLSRQELAILRLTARGLSNKRIGQGLSLSENTVRNNLTCICEKMGVPLDENTHRRVAAISKSKDLGAAGRLRGQEINALVWSGTSFPPRHFTV